MLKWFMPTSHLADNPLEILRHRLEAGVKATPLCLAIMGWLANVTMVPFVAAIMLRGEQVALRLSDEAALGPLGSVGDFLNQIAVICRSLSLDGAQTSYLLTRARDLLD